MRKSNRCTRERIVSGIRFGSVVARTNTTWGGGLLQGLEQAVEGGLRQHVHFVDDVDLVAGARRRIGGVLPEPPDVVDSRVRRAVDLLDVHARAGEDLDA
jgi:hypothetical protein